MRIGVICVHGGLRHLLRLFPDGLSPSLLCRVVTFHHKTKQQSGYTVSPGTLLFVHLAGNACTHSVRARDTSAQATLTTTFTKILCGKWKKQALFVAVAAVEHVW